MAKTKWPDEVPVLEPDDICKGSFGTADGRRCIVGWAREVFGLLTGECDEMLNTVRVAYRDIEGVDFRGGMFEFNDDTPSDLVARVWNRATARLGYVVNNPEAKHLKTN